MSISIVTRPRPIRRLDGEKVFERRNLTVTVDQIVHPDGRDGEYVLVDTGCRYAVSVIPLAVIDGEARIALVRQHRYPVDDYTLELPGGGASAIAPQEALRELVEETGIIPDSIELLGVSYQAAGSSPITGSTWLAHVPAAAADLAYVEGESGAVTEWYTVPEILTMMATGTINCTITLAALAQAIVAGKFGTLMKECS
ncbi:NUDIX hydrolase [Paeniglutamicibacter antarcticus]|uniref:NUDIX hydrolase n=1 Tax=Arthrobacter terrae TaxID=2935737 RepID=A0A931G722_9MICC|nr:NUDIX hydrolase [Arthrobacter terrae]MBG0738824.1 NUDIX hydrolase [Arthrobacter terrae]